ncbi:MAG TPA: adenylyltransferase/cytidyltransferase family protein [Rhabdochlamydiaceae bacterium]|nr:adenylyltransferase/cytidyltransferase family protein [Rhabdochlamydiaceae bacterium]
MFKKIMFCFFVCFFSMNGYADPGVHSRPVRVYADIVGDLFHMGHVEFFKNAKAYGDYLIIGVLSDESVASYKRIPILTLEERVAVIKACKYVDEVIAAPPLRTTKEWLEEHQIDIVVHGDDFNKEQLLDQYTAPIEMDIFKIVPYTRGISSTDIIKRIKERVAK